jgi:hypothetical protein
MISPFTFTSTCSMMSARGDAIASATITAATTMFLTFM